jgi:hypothetical protein
MHSGGNDRFCARLKTDISAFSSGLQGHLRLCLTILDSSRRPLSKNVRHDLVRPQRLELEAEMSVFNLAQKRSFPPLCNACSGLDDPAARTSTLLYATLRYSTLLYATLHYSTLLYATLRYSTTLCYSMLLYATLCYSTIRYDTIIRYK